MDNKKISTGLGIAVIVIIVITVGLLVWKYQRIQKQEKTQDQNITVHPKTVEKNFNQEQEQQFQEIDPQEIERLDNITKNWKIFRDEKYGYEFKYPQDYTIEKPASGEYNKTINVISNEKYYGIDGGCPNPPCKAKKISNEIIISYSPKTIGDVKESLKGNVWYESSGRHVILNGKNAFYYKRDLPVLNINIESSSGGTFYIKMDLFPQFENIFQGIYSTFKEIN